MALQFRRGTAAERIAASDIPESGEPWFTYDDNKLYVGDGSTPGGVLVSASEVQQLSDTNLISEATNTLIDYQITSNVATVSTTTNHGYYEGLEIAISGSAVTILNGTHTIASIVSGSSFTFALTNDDVAQTGADGTVTPLIPDNDILIWSQTDGEWQNSALEIVNDTTPQLGGDLDVNSNDIVSTSNGNINLTPNGTGEVTVKGNATGGSGKIVLNCEENSHAVKIQGPPHSAAANYTLTLPSGVGTSGQSLTTDGSGGLSWATPASALDDLTDVAAASPGDGQALVYNDTSGNWEAGTVSTSEPLYTTFDYYYGGTAPASVIADSDQLGWNFGTWTERVYDPSGIGPSDDTFDPTLTGVTFDGTTGKFTGLPQGRYKISVAFVVTIDNVTTGSGGFLSHGLTLVSSSFSYLQTSVLERTTVLPYTSYGSTAYSYTIHLETVGAAEDATASNNTVLIFLDQDQGPTYYITSATLNIIKFADI